MRVVHIGFAGFCLVALSGCFFTAIGMDHDAMRRSFDFGPPETVRLCVFLDRGITENRARDLLSSWNSEAAKYALSVEPVSFTRLARNGFFHDSIVREVQAQKLAPGCDRKLYFVGRNVGDFLWGDVAALALPMPEVLGEVDDATLTSGFVIATVLSPNQLLFPPYAVTRHELYHLLGCKQHFDMPACYAEIATLKWREHELEAGGFFDRIGEQPFYPTWKNLGDSTLDSRAAVNRVLAASHNPVETAAAASQPGAARNPERASPTPRRVSLSVVASRAAPH